MSTLAANKAMITVIDTTALSVLVIMELYESMIMYVNSSNRRLAINAPMNDEKNPYVMFGGIIGVSSEGIEYR